MSLKPDLIQPVPEETARIAKAAFRKGNPLLKLRDELGSIFSDADFADLFPKLGQPGLAPWRRGADHRPAVPREPARPTRR
jgi:transposase